MLNIEKAKEFIVNTARPIDFAVYKYFFENGSSENVVEELQKYQNDDGGFGHGLEADNWNPESSPITTNDAIITLYKVGALESNKKMIEDIVRYLKSHDSFDEEKRCWLFAIESNVKYPHAVWWEKTDDGITGYNPTASLAAFMICYGERTAYYEEILKNAYDYLKSAEKIDTDSLKCFQLCYALLIKKQIFDVIPLDELKNMLENKIEAIICRDTLKYGVEYIACPSDFFPGVYAELITPGIRELMDVEKSILERIQKEDGGFDITWIWYNEYAEFEQARAWWRPRITIDKLLFCTT